MGCGFILQPDGLIHTSPGHRPGWVVVVGGQAESLHHTWRGGSAVDEADFQPAMCFLTCDPGRRPMDSALPWAGMSEPVGLFNLSASPTGLHPPAQGWRSYLGYSLEESILPQGGYVILRERTDITPLEYTIML